MASQLLTTSEVADRTSLSERQVARLLASGDLPSVKIGRARRVREDDLERFIAERLDTPAGAA